MKLLTVSHWGERKLASTFEDDVSPEVLGAKTLGQPFIARKLLTSGIPYVTKDGYRLTLETVE